MTEMGLPAMPVQGKFSKEFALMASCSWLVPEYLEPEQRKYITEACSTPVDWDSYTKLAQRHGVTVIAYKVLKQYADVVPDSALKVLQQSNSNSRRHALFQTAELVKLLGIFVGRGIEAIPLKGVYLAHQLYSDFAVRTSGDLDILVRPDNVETAEQILESNGYVCEIAGSSLTILQKRYLRTHIHHYVFVHSESGLHVELHWSLGSWSEQQMEILWENITIQTWHNLQIPTFSYEYLLLVLCDHGAKHEWQCLKWLSDVAPLFESKDNINWDNVLTLARQLDLERVLAHSALMVHWVYGISLPDLLQKLILKDNQVSGLCESSIAALMMDGKAILEAGKNARSLRLAWRTKKLRPSMSYLTAFRSTFVSPCDWDLVKLPPFLFWLYYPLRPLLWFYRHYLK